MIPSASAIDLMITSPTNTTYTSLSVDLKWDTNETASWGFYSLDGSSNVTIALHSGILTDWDDTEDKNGTVNMFNPNNAYDEDWSTYSNAGPSASPTYTGTSYVYENYSLNDISDLSAVEIHVYNKYQASGNSFLGSLEHSVDFWNYTSNDWVQIGSKSAVLGVYYLQSNVTNISEYMNGTYLQVRNKMIDTTGSYGLSMFESKIRFNWTAKNITFTTSDGNHNIVIFANNSLNNSNSSVIYFTVDTTPPTPSNPVYPASINELTVFDISIDVTDALSSVDTVTLDIFGINRTMTNITDTYSVTINSPFVTQNTEYNFNFYFNDTNGHLSNASYVITVDNIAGGSGGEGGGTATPIIPECGRFLVAYYGRIEIGGTPKVLSPPVVVPIVNGNKTQNIFVKFDYEMQPYCKITDGPENPVYAGAQTSFVFDCRIPETVTNGNVVVFLSEECQQAVPVSLLPDNTFMSNMGDFLRLAMSGSWDSFRLTYHSIPLVVIVTIVIMFGLVLWKA